ncbi:hypothetical protein N7507_008669 [Penicillium longicatenatum]|nr:hypothetical protein N7507_008669 [Penicillium longicatenatum]
MGILRTVAIGTTAYKIGKKTAVRVDPTTAALLLPGYPPQYHYGQPPYGQNPYGAPQYPQGHGGSYQGYPPQQYSRSVEDPATNGGSRSMQAFPPPYQHNSAYENKSEKSPAQTKNQGSCSQERPN